MGFVTRLMFWANTVLFAVGCSQMHRSTALAQSKPLPAAQAGDEFQPQIGQPTSAHVVARRVDWPPRPRPCFVLFDRDSQEVLVADLATNRLCYLNGKFYWVAPVGQGLAVCRSVQLGTNELTGEKATELALKAFRGQVVGYELRVDLKPLLKQEEDAHRARHLAAMLCVPHAEMKIDGGNLRASFKSATGYLGTVLLSPEPKVLSMALTGFTPWTAEEANALTNTPSGK
jgi:hypothetical protein